MRQWLGIFLLVSLFLYAGLVLDQHRTSGVNPSIEALQKAVTGAGGSLEAAEFTLLAPISDPAVPGRIRERLGWSTGNPVGEVRDARLYTDRGGYYLSVQWRMTGDRAAAWTKNHALLTAALQQESISTPILVQLEAKASRPPAGLLHLAHTALDAVGATERQPWSAERSASAAGRSPLLPRGPHPVNVQVAVRETAEGVRLWAAWPAMEGDY